MRSTCFDEAPNVLCAEVDFPRMYGSKHCFLQQENSFRYEDSAEGIRGIQSGSFDKIRAIFNKSLCISAFTSET